MKRVKLYSILLTVTLATTLMAGCGKSKDSDNKSSTSDKSPITFSFYSADGSFSDDFKNPVAKEITKRTGVTLKMEYPVGGNSTQKIPLMIASKDYPDLIFAKGDSQKLVDAGALVKLDKYIEKEGPNVKALYGKYLPRLRDSLDDPSIYTLGSNGVGAEIYNPGPAVEIQCAVLKDQGYPQLKSLTDYENALKAYTQKYPTINGQKTIPMSLLADDWRWMITIANPPGTATGHPDDGQWLVDQKTYKAQYKFLSDDFKQYYKWLNHMYATGMIDPDSFTQKYDQYKAKIATGRVLGIADANYDYNESEKTLVADGHPERTYALLPIVLDPSTQKNVSMRDPGYSGGWGVGITTSCKNPERAFKFLDWMASDEAQVLNNWGIKGVHYEVKDGKRVLTPEQLKERNTDKDFGKKTGVGLYTYPFPQRGDGLKDSTGSTYSTNTEQTIIDGYNDAQKETLKAYNVKMWKDLFPQTKEFPVSPYGAVWQLSIPTDSELTTIQTKADNYCQTNIPKLIMSNPSGFDSNWSKIQSDLKGLNIDKANDDMTKMISDRMKLIGTKK